MEFVRCCEACQKLGNLIHAPTVEMGSLNSPWPFHTWSMDVIGPISPPSKEKIWILAATENFTEWLEYLLKGQHLKLSENLFSIILFADLEFLGEYCRTMVLLLLDNHLSYY